MAFNRRICLKTDGTNMRILQIAPRVCWPLDTGAKLRNFHLGRILGESALVTFLGFQHDGEPASIPNTKYEKVITVRRGSGYTVNNALRGALGNTPLPLLNYTTEPMKQALRRVLVQNDFDLVQLESIHLMGYVPIIRASRSNPLVVCDWHNIESELMRRYGEREGNILRRNYARRTTKLMADAEKQAMVKLDAHVTVSERDAEQLHALNSKAQVFVIENGVDAIFYSDEQIANAHQRWAEQTSAVSSRKDRIVFVGSMDYHANIDGVVRFCREVWPRLRERKPDLVFTIVGRDPAPSVQELANMPGVNVTGTVDDVRPYYHEAIASIVPLKVGGGSRLKILESMAAGVPVVSTTLGAEGLNVTHNENIVIADSDNAMIAEVVRIIEDNGTRSQLVAAGRDLVVKQYDWSTLGTSLFKNYVELLSERKTA
jgi:sugar transferase (PEP-CTERM/EpsH1 system associated)